MGALLGLSVFSTESVESVIQTIMMHIPQEIVQQKPSFSECFARSFYMDLIFYGILHKKPIKTFAKLRRVCYY